MKKTAARLWPKPLRHLVYLGALPLCGYIFMTVLLGLDSEGSAYILLLAIFAAAGTGGLLFRRGYGPVAAAMGAAWPATAAAWWKLHWAMGMSSPGGSAQELIRLMGWSDASMTSAIAVVTAVCGLGGWLFMRFDRWYENKTGHSLFEQDE